MTQIYNRIKLIRESLDIPVKEFSSAVHLNPEWTESIEENKIPISMGLMARICDYFKAPLEDIFFLADEDGKIKDWEADNE